MKRPFMYRDEVGSLIYLFIFIILFILTIYIFFVNILYGIVAFITSLAIMTACEPLMKNSQKRVDDYNKSIGIENNEN